MWVKRNKLGNIQIKILFSIFAFAILLCTNSQEAFACTVPLIPGSAWFNDTTTLSKGSSSNLPPGVTISVTTNQLVVTNSSTIPLYILGQQQAGETYMAVSATGIPLGFSPLIKIDQQNYFFWQYNQWFKEGSSPLSLQSGGRFDQDSLTTLYPDILDWHKNYAMRPTTIVVPAPQNGNLLLLANNNVYSVPFVISYKLNPNYQPPSNGGGCGFFLYQGAFFWLGIFFGSLVFVGLIVGLIARKIAPRFPVRPAKANKQNPLPEIEQPLSPPIYTSGDDGEQLPSSQTLNKPIKKK